MVKLLIGHKGSGKTKQMIFLANQSVDAKDGSIVFINRNHRLMLDLNHRIRVVCMEDYEHITNSDEYIGFVYGIISSDHDIEEIYIESILKYADIQLKDLEEFLTRLDRISQKYGPDFIVSISVEMQELGDFIKKYKILN
ncbi:hypothetical protein [Sinanaerobacter sp. ZZT-01]|uniref:hypothetical protein n=1 Tax=Sinanaerobacter sp. ZZT-01 TaxID=3111540 RepID=UPI002D7A18E8|nr:hypothetical protein [Sinanaerobacter sp. ZZT-01]WRR92555.1 hypothetical protein U5921_10905 [Sinanaerobacter sp. ZZT-01]